MELEDKHSVRVCTQPQKNSSFLSYAKYIQNSPRQKLHLPREKKERNVYFLQNNLFQYIYSSKFSTKN